MIAGRVPAHENGEERHEGRGAPHDCQHHRELTVSHYQRVVQGLHDGVVTVNTDAAQVEDRRRREVNVEGVPHVAHEIPEDPFAVSQLDTKIKTHREYRHQHVGQREADHEEVRYDPQLPMPHDGNDHQEVPEKRRQDDEPHQHELHENQEHNKTTVPIRRDQRLVLHHRFDNVQSHNMLNQRRFLRVHFGHFTFSPVSSVAGQDARGTWAPWRRDRETGDRIGDDTASVAPVLRHLLYTILPRLGAQAVWRKPRFYYIPRSPLARL